MRFTLAWDQESGQQEQHKLWQGVQCNGGLAAGWKAAFLPPFLKGWHLEKFISASTG